MDNSAGTSEVQVIEEKLAGVLSGTKNLTLGTSSGDVPWTAGGYFAEDGLFALSMILEKTGTTMTNIRSNPCVAVSITTGNPFEPFAQAQAEVEIVDDADAVAAIHARLRGKIPEIEPLLGIPVDTVLLRVVTWKVTDIPAGWLPAKVLKAPGLVSA
jgi:hypothetical protein